MENNLFNSNNAKSLLLEFVGILALAIALFLFVQAFASKAIVDGSSMEPNLSHGQKILVNKVAYLFSEPQRGDIIIFDPPLSSENDYIKRVIGLTGEFVEIKNGTVYIHQSNGNILTLDESAYIVDSPDYNYTSEVIPENHFFVLGDNRNNSGDSHYGWFVARADIVGKAWFSYSPISDFGFVLNYSFE
ncbi:MAG: signal peptidase I [Dehalococcoidales bacterium]|nr:signal peptidase I [Dehalococcoidales bacterium]